MKAEKVYTKILLISTAIFIAGFHSIKAHGEGQPDQPYKTTLSELTLEEKVGQLIWLEITDKTKNLSTLLKRYHPAGISIISSDPYKVRKWTEIAASYGVKSRILIDADISSLQNLAQFPDYSSMKFLSDSADVEKYHQATRRQMSALGIDRSIRYGVDLGLNLAPSPGHDEVLKKDLFESDGIIISQDPAYWYGEIYRMVKTGEIPMSYLELKVEKVLEVKNQIVPQQQSEDSGLDYLLPGKINSPEDLALIEVLYQHSFTQYKNTRNSIPVNELNDKKLLYLSGSNNPPAFGKMLNMYYPVESCHYTNLAELEIQHLEDDYRYIFLDVSGDISSEELEILKSLDEFQDLIVTYFGSHTELSKLKSLSTVLWHPEDNKITRNIAPQIIFGGLTIKGSSGGPFRLSYSSPENAGMDSHVLLEIDEIASELVKDRATPGCQILVAKDGAIVYNKTFGSLFYEQNSPVTPETLYDLASITKVLATLPAIMYLDQAGIVDIDQRLSDYLLDLEGTDKEDVIIRDVLIHQAGLYPYLPFWRQSVNQEGPIPELYSAEQENAHSKMVAQGLYSNESLQDSLWKWTVDSKMRKKPKEGKGYDYKYSDLGFYMLKELFERTSGMTLDQFSESYLYVPMGLKSLTFNPASKYSLERIAPTERDTYFRKALIHGTVHDQTAAMFGGVAGHAGLFANANDLAKIMQMFMWDGQYGGTRYFEKQIVEKYIQKQNHENRRGLGWDKPDPEGEGNTSTHASFSSFGHTGFTGTSVWADPEYGLVYVFLSNRIYPNANNNRLSTGNYRIRIQDVIYQSVFEYEKSHSY